MSDHPQMHQDDDNLFDSSTYAAKKLAVINSMTEQEFQAQRADPGTAYLRNLLGKPDQTFEEWKAEASATYKKML